MKRMTPDEPARATLVVGPNFGHVAVHATQGFSRQVERSDCVAAGTAALPRIVLILPALPTIIVDIRGRPTLWQVPQYSLVRCTGFSMASRCGPGLAPKKGIVHPPTGTVFCPRKRILVRGRHYISPIALYISQGFNGMTGQTRQSGLRTGMIHVDRNVVGHMPGKEDQRIMAGRTPSVRDRCRPVPQVPQHFCDSRGC